MTSGAEIIVTDLTDPHPLLDAFRRIGVRLENFEAMERGAIGQETAACFADPFGVLSKHPLRFRRLKRRFNAAGRPVIAWNRDAPWNCAIKPWRKPWIRPLGLIDIYLAHSLQGADAFGTNVHYFPNAADVDAYNLRGATLESLRDPGRYRVDVAFYGSLSPSYPRVGARIAFIAALKDRLRAAGVSMDIRDACPGPEQMNVVQQIEQIQTSRVNLSVGAVCDDRERSWGMPERCFGVPASGGFLLCDHRRHAADTFPADAWSDFRDLEDCVQRIRHFLDHFDETRRRAEVLHAEVMAHHSYRHRAEAILALARDWRRQRS
ncbi:MAG: glycosyltransferase [Burkholderiales bacterium]|nr:glycosyltransferase [Burkholderiales bacterium]